MNVKVTGNPNYTHLKIETYYDKGGYSLFTYEDQPRGYYVSVCPFESRGGMEAWTLFSGYKKFLEPCSRYSKKTFERLDACTLDNCAELVEKVCDKYGLTLAEDLTEAFANHVA